MSKIKIGNVNAENNVFGDKNIITNNFVTKQSSNKVLIRENYFQMILEIRDLERISLENYLEDKYQKFISKNPNLIKILYKDIYKVLDGIDNEDNLDVVIENGDFVIENGDIKLSGHPTNLHYALTWLHVKLIEDIIEKDPNNLISEIDNFENAFLKVNYDTPSYKKKLSDLKLEIRKEIKNKNKSNLSWNDVNEIIILKPSLFGIGVNLNALFGKLIRFFLIHL